MGTRRNSRCAHQRQEVAQEAARIMREEGVRDYLLAKRKAVNRLGVVDRNALAANDEIAAALAEQQRLFGGAAYAERLQELRVVARKAMKLFEAFSPRLVGAVLSGAVTDQTAVNLHVFSDAPESIAHCLLERKIPYDIDEYRVRYRHDRYELQPVYSFATGDVGVEATVFPVTGLRQPPYCPVDGKPMQRVRLPAVEALVGVDAETAAAQSLSETGM